jgi:hypothetical protein
VSPAESAKVVLILATNWASPRPDPEHLRLYEKMIQGLDLATAEATAMELIATSESAFLPKPAEFLRKAAARAMAREGRNNILTGEEAWAQVQRAIEQRGFYQGPGSQEETILHVIKAISWDQLCHNDNVEASRAHFLKIFDRFHRRAVGDEIAALVGHQQGWALGTPLRRPALTHQSEEEE